MKKKDVLNMKKYMGSTMALIMIASNTLQALQVQAAEDEVSIYDKQTESEDSVSLDYGSNKEENFIEGVEPKIDDTDDVINVKNEKDETEDIYKNMSDNDEESQDKDEKILEDNEEIIEEIESEKNESEIDEEIKISEIPTKVRKGDGLEEIKEIELSPEEMEKIPEHNTENYMELYNSSSSTLNYSTRRGRDSLADFSNAVVLQKGYDLVLNYLNSVHNGSCKPEITLNNGNYYLEKINISSIGNISLDDLRKIYLTIKYDHPEFFWIGNMYSYSRMSSSNYVSSVSIAIQSHFKDITSIKVGKRNLDKAVEEYFEAASGCISDYDIEKAFHDKMIRDAVYDPYVNNSSYINLNSHNVLGVLVDKVGVCESYAKAMQLLLNAKGIDNVYVTGYAGEGHAWNQVKINGVYCNLDTTWDDLDSIENGGIQYNYFNVPDSDFNASHTPNKPSGTNEYLYAVKECTSSEYTWFNQNKDNVFSASESSDDEAKKAFLVSQIKKSLEKDDYNVQISAENYTTANALLNYMQNNFSIILNSDEINSLYHSKCTTNGFSYTGLNRGTREFTIKFTPLSPVKASSITMPNKITINTLKNSKYLSPIISPDTTSETIKWTSSNSNVVMMDSKGKGVIVPKSKGKAIVTATIGDVSASCEVTVCDPVYSDKDELQKLYDDNKDKTAESYTVDSWNVFKYALDNAKSVLDDENALQDIVDKAKLDLETAITNLALNIDKSALQKLYDDNSDKTASSYVSTTWYAFDKAMKNAKNVLDNADALQAEVDKAKIDLEDALGKLVIAGNKTELQKLYDDNKDKVKTSYTSITWSDFDKAMKNAKSVLDNGDATQNQVDKAKADLESAISKLAVVGDKSQLQKLYDNNKNKIQSSYVSSTWLEFDKAMKNAKNVLDNADAIQGEIDKAKLDLDKAISNLVIRGDKTELQQLYNSNKSKTQGNYTNSSWAEFETALNYAKSVLDNIDAVQSEINEAKTKLQFALNKLIGKVDTSKLQQLYDDNKNKTREQYISVGWDDFIKALNNAKSILDKEEPSETEVADAENKLSNASGSLVKKADTTALKNLYDSNKTRVELSYTSTSWSLFAKAMEDAEVVINNEEAVQSEVDSAKAKLENAINKLVLRGDKTELQQLYNENKTKSESAYTSSSWSDFAKAKENAENVLKDSDATQSSVDSAMKTLKSTIASLVARGNKTSLQNLYYANKSKNEEDYISSTWIGFAKAMASAQTILNDKDAVQLAIDKAENDLKTALEKLSLRGTKEDLQKLYDMNKDRDSSLYVSTTWNSFAKALSGAKTVLDNQNALQNDIDTAKINLEKAVKGLSERGNKEQLRILYNDNKNIKSADYSNRSYSKFKDALDNAAKVLDNKDALQRDIDSAKSLLEDAVKSLVNISKLKSVYNANKDKKKGDYTDTSWAVFTKALSDANSALGKADISQSQADAAELSLQKAVYGLKLKAKKTNLQNLYTANKSRKVTKYSIESWLPFKTALDNAASILNKDEASQEEVDTAVSNLSNAVSALIEITDKSSLQSLYNANKAKEQGKISDTKWSVFTKALDNAKSILDKTDATQEETDNAYNTLKNAVSDLGSSGHGGGHSGGSSGGGSGSSSSKDDSKFKIYKEITVTVNGKTIINIYDKIEDNEKLSLGDKIKDNLKKMIDSLKDNIGFDLENKVPNISKFKNDNLDLDISQFKNNVEDFMYINCNKVGKESEKVNIGGSFKEGSTYVYIVDKLTKKLINADYLNEEDAKEIKEGSLGLKMKNGYEYLVTDSPMDALKDNDWNNVDGKWMYIKDAAVKNGWLKSRDNNWYYSDNNGVMQTGWIKDVNGEWYNLSDSGAMNTGWFKDKDGRWYYLNSNGSMKKGWHKDVNGKWYYLEANGSMKTGWLKDSEGNWYYLNGDGSMAVNTIINGYRLGSNGAWIK